MGGTKSTDENGNHKREKEETSGTVDQNLREKEGDSNPGGKVGQILLSQRQVTTKNAGAAAGREWGVKHYGRIERNVRNGWKVICRRRGLSAIFNSRGLRKKEKKTERYYKSHTHC